MAKLLDFQASISDVKQVNPLFSTCKVRVLYTGRNRNMSILTKDSVEKALPTLSNIPIVGEYEEANEDYKGHGGAINLDDYKYIHTTKPYGVVPESATYEWEEVKGRDGTIREYLVINGCYLWTGRYEEAYEVVENGKGQSMEIEVTDGKWLEDEEAYQIDSFIFSALCILGDDVEPAFEDANITAYSLDRDSFKKEFTTMLSELKTSLSQEKEVNTMLKELLKKYSLTVEDLTAKGIDFNEISEDELEAKIIEVFEIGVNDNPLDGGDESQEGDSQDEDNSQDDENQDDESADNEGEENQDNNEEDNNDNADEDNQEDDNDEDDKGKEGKSKEDFQVRISELEKELATANGTIDTLTTEVQDLRQFKLDVEKLDHEAKVQEVFTNFQLVEEDVKDLDIHKFSLEEIEEKCYAILGRKMASKKNFSKQKGNIRLPLGEGEDNQDKNESPYGDLFEKYNKQ